jgi:hypothetical protein
MFKSNWNFSEKKINFQNAQNFFNTVENQNLINLKASSFCNPSEYYINKQLQYLQNQNNTPTSVNYQQNSSLNSIDKLFSPNLEKTGEKKRSKKEGSSANENQFVIYLENV